MSDRAFTEAEIEAFVASGYRSYSAMSQKDEFVGVELLKKDDGIELVVALRPPRPSSRFMVNKADDSTEYDHLKMIVARSVLEAHDTARKHAAELRWNCIETFLRADVEHQRFDAKRMKDALMSCLGDEERERLAIELMQTVEAVKR